MSLFWPESAYTLGHNPGSNPVEGVPKAERVLPWFQSSVAGGASASANGASHAVDLEFVDPLRRADMLEAALTERHSSQAGHPGSLGDEASVSA